MDADDAEAAAPGSAPPAEPVPEPEPSAQLDPGHAVPDADPPEGIMLDDDLIVAPLGDGAHAWTLLRQGGPPPGWGAVPHAAVVAEIRADRLLLEDFPVGRVAEFLEVRERLRPGEVTTIVVPLLRAAERLRAAPDGETWLSPGCAAIRATGEVVLLPRTATGSGSRAGDAGRLIYQLLVGRRWEEAGIPLRQAREDLSDAMVDGVAELFTAPALDTPALIADLVGWAPPEPLTLMPAVPGADPATAITAEVAPGSVLARLREHLGEERAAPPDPAPRKQAPRGRGARGSRAGTRDAWDVAGRAPPRGGSGIRGSPRLSAGRTRGGAPPPAAARRCARAAGAGRP